MIGLMGDTEVDAIAIKVGLSPSKNICVICLIESPLKMMKNAFYLSFSSYLSFCHDFLVM